MSAALQEITEVLADYFGALHFSDTDRLRRVFHPYAIYATADESPPLFRSMDEYSAVVAARQSPAARGERRRDQIDRIEVAGDNTAAAKVRCSIGNRDCVDFLSLLRVDGRWQIVAKVFQIIEMSKD